MTWLPVVEREMRVASRRRGTYWTRFWAALAMIVVFAFVILDESNSGMNGSHAGMALFVPLTLLASLFAILLGVIATSDSVSEEKRDGTLGLLFLTDLKGHDVILGKLVAHSMNGFYAMVAFLPVLGVPLLMGGVTFLQFAKLIIVLVGLIVLSLAAGIFVSTHSRNERKAMIFTFLLLFGIVIGPVLLMIWMDNEQLCKEQNIWRGLMFSPAYAVECICYPSFPFPKPSFWGCVGWTWFGALTLLVIASRAAPGSWTEAGVKTRSRSPRSRTMFSEWMKKSRRRILEESPFTWLAMRGEASQARVWFFLVAIFLIWVMCVLKQGSNFGWDMAVPALVIAHIGLKLWVAGEAPRRFVEDRHNNAMEFLLSTPLNERQIIWGQWRALVRQFLWPVVTLLLLEAIFVRAAHRSPNWDGGSSVASQLWSMFFLPVDMVALAWAGMWLGMKCKGRNRAMVGGFAAIVVAPALLAQVLTTLAEHAGFFSSAWSGGRNQFEEFHLLVFVCLSLAIDLTAMLWPQMRLLTGFRQMALEGFRTKAG